MAFEFYLALFVLNGIAGMIAVAWALKLEVRAYGVSDLENSDFTAKSVWGKYLQATGVTFTVLFLGAIALVYVYHCYERYDKQYLEDFESRVRTYIALRKTE